MKIAFRLTGAYFPERYVKARVERFLYVRNVKTSLAFIQSSFYHINSNVFYKDLYLLNIRQSYMSRDYMGI